VGARAYDLKGILELRDGSAAVQQGLQTLDKFSGPFGEIGERTFTDFISIAKGLA